MDNCKGTILIVDDNADIRNKAVRMFYLNEEL